MPVALQRNIALSKYTTFAIGGPAKWFSEVFTVGDLQEVLIFSQNSSLPIFLLGGGSNCFFSDRGFDGVVIRNCISFFEQKEGLIRVGSGYSFSLLGRKTASLGLAGLEFAFGIPGSLGGAIFMNAGAHGGEVSQCLRRVWVLSPERKDCWVEAKDLEFGYRFSSFQKELRASIILGAEFSLTPSLGVVERQKEWFLPRARTQPKGKSAGCVFRNPSPALPAGLLIDQCGLKGARRGGAVVSSLHANFIVNDNRATAEDVLELLSFIKNRVQEEKKVLLHEEVRYIPPF